MLPVDDGEMPANLQAFLFSPSWSATGVSPQPRLYRVEPGGQRALVELIHSEELKTVRPAQPVEPGTLLELEWSDLCATLGEDPPPRVRTRTRVTAGKPLPTALGHLRADYHEDTIEVPRNPNCKETVRAAFWDLHVELSSEAEAYRDQLSYELVIDGKVTRSYTVPQSFPVHFGGSKLGRGSDRVYGLCNAGQEYAGNLGVGLHRVSMVGRLPDGTRVESDEVELGYAPCSSSVDAGLGRTAAKPLHPDAGEPSTSSNAGDAAMNERGPSPSGDISPEAAGDDSDQEDPNALAKPDATDAGCSLGPLGTSTAPWLVLVVGLLCVTRRRGI